ncbi:unc-112-related protein-like [Haematobia irritans]|uniref:unc-112-related protein-like n=1 Tax=Haematobia irritans TaxID=7368 RepID=UPI003F4FB4F5
MIHVGENTWNLRIFITDLQVEKQLRVRGDQHIGGIMLQLVDPEHPKDWSDHALWWPERNIWLSRTRSTLDQVGVQADCLLHFTPMHKILRVQLPDLRFLDCRVDFSIKTFTAVVNLCKDLDIRHPEELSLCKPLEAEHLKKNYGKYPQKKVAIPEPNGTVYLQPAPDTNSFIPINSAYKGGSSGSLDRTQNGGNLLCAPVSPYNTTPRRGGTAPGTPIMSSPTGTWKNTSNGYGTYDSSSSLGDFQENLAASPRCPSPDVRSRLVRPKSLIEKARMNVGWLDSSLSIMEQGIREYDALCLRFKYYTFFDLNPKYDLVRINQLYEQAKWSILNEELDCSEEESLMFAALQFQINRLNEAQCYQDSGMDSTFNDDGDDGVDSLLNELQITLEGPNSSHDGNITKIPELSDYLRFLKPRKFTMKGYKRYFFAYRDLHLHLYKTAEDSRRGAPVITINLRGCEVTPDINLSQQKFSIRLEVPPEGGNGPNTEVWIRCETEDQYAKWMAACRLAAKGRSLADSSYDAEVTNIKTLLDLQKPNNKAAVNIDPRTIDTQDYLSPKMLRKLSGKAAMRILEAHANVTKLTCIEAKMKYIQAWQSLPDFGVSLFVIKFDGHKKEELLGVAHNRIMRMDLNTGDHIKTWRYNTMKAWNVNWGIKCMMIQFNDENVVFSCLSSDCKVVHEFIGGYIFMAMRSKENNQTLNEDMFHKLTGGWV